MQSILNFAKSFEKICCLDAIGAPEIIAHLAQREPQADEVAVAVARNLLGEGRLGALDFVAVVDFSSDFEYQGCATSSQSADISASQCSVALELGVALPLGNERVIHTHACILSVPNLSIPV